MTSREKDSLYRESGAYNFFPEFNNLFISTIPEST